MIRAIIVVVKVLSNLVNLVFCLRFVLFLIIVEKWIFLVIEIFFILSYKNLNNFQMTTNDIEKMEEAKLKAKFPNVLNRPVGGHSAFLQKRLAKGVNSTFSYS